MKVGHLVNILQAHNFDAEVFVAGESKGELRVPGEAKLEQDESTKTFRLVLATSARPDPAAGADGEPADNPPAPGEAGEGGEGGGAGDGGDAGGGGSGSGE